MTEPRRPQPDTLTTYLDEAGGYELLDADEELRQARRVVECRRQCWCAAISMTPWRTLVDRARSLLGEDAPHFDRIAPRTDAERVALADDLMAADPEGRLLDDLEALAEDGPGRAAFEMARRRHCRVRNRFICSNLRLVMMVAKQYGRFHMPLADRVQEGNFGLFKAIDRFDPERGCRFSTYAAWWIRHAVTRALVDAGRTVRVPAYIHALFTRARRARVALAAELGRAPSLEEVGNRLRVPPEKLVHAITAMELRVVGLDDADGGATGLTASEVLTVDGADWAERLSSSIDAQLADHVLDELDEKSFAIVTHRFGLRGAEHRTLSALGATYGVSRERIRQVQNRALRQLRRSMRASAVGSVAVPSPSAS
jgi:RNA polymerase sigma factor (sigma-70 family)